jgi:hypothetical protein
MATHRAFPFRFALPVAQLFVCLMLLWPVRDFLVMSASKNLYIANPPSTVEEQARADALIRLFERRKLAPLVLDFPVLLAQVPYILVTPTKREWVPQGMFTDVWRALSWPFAGMFFWWVLGRGVEALFAVRRSVVQPRITWAETSFAGIMFVVGLLTLVGILTSTPDDRRDMQFIAWITGGVLWGILSTVIIASWFRIQRNL